MKKVLLVEDSLTEAERIARFLEKAGYSVYEVRSGEEAQLRLKQQKPDLILLDLILPGQSGFEFCRKLKGDPVTKAIPVVICSTKNTDVDRTWGSMSGADAYLTKPVDEKILLETIGQFIR
jgi:twitching motility two-component system response regulator PilH